MASLSSRSSNGPDPDEQQMRQLENAATQAGWQEESGFRKDVLRYLAQTDIPDASKREFLNLISRDWVFANLSDAGYNELKWELRHLKHLFYDNHPAHDCLVTGDIRAAINDDPRDTLKPLDDGDIQQVEQLFRTIRLRLTRSKGMQQQRIIQTNISQTEVNRPDGGGGNGLWSKLKR